MRTTMLQLPEWLPLDLIVLGVLAAVAVAGILAMASPRAFSLLAQRSGSWIDTNRIVYRLDKPIDINRAVLRYSRVFGGLLLAAVAFVAYVYWQEVLGGTWPLW